MPLCFGCVGVKLVYSLWPSGGWNLQSYHSMPLGSTPIQPIRCCLAKGSRLWVGYWNKVHVVDVDGRKIEVKRKEQSMKCVLFKPALQPAAIINSSPTQQTFPVSERSEKQVRFLCAGGSGVWASCRLDPILRLFDCSTGRPLQEIDFSVLVTKTLGTTKAGVLMTLVQMNKMWLLR